jgi:hypothetical protein
VITVPAHLQQHAYRYRRFRRWVGLLVNSFGYSEPLLAEILETTEAMVRGDEEPSNSLELTRLWRRAGRLIELPSVTR